MNSFIKGIIRARPRRTVGGLLIATTVALTACDDDDPSGPGDETGEVEAIVIDDPQSGAPAIAASGEALSFASAAAAAFTGTVAGEFRASISIDGETWVDLGSLNGISVNLQATGDQTSIHGAQPVPVGTYSRVRLVIRGADAELAAGSVIGTITLGADTSVSVGAGGEIVVERAVVPITIQADMRARVVFDLNAEAWLTESAVTLGTASATDVEANVAAAAMIVTT